MNSVIANRASEMYEIMFSYEYLVALRNPLELCFLLK